MTPDSSSPETPSRRQFLATAAASATLSHSALAELHNVAAGSQGFPQVHLSKPLYTRQEALYLGSLIGDAMGGPYEFIPRDEVAEKQGREPWTPDDKLTYEQLDEMDQAIGLPRYTDLRPAADPYGPLTVNAPMGTLTDDSRFKVILANAWWAAHLKHRGWPKPEDIARAVLDFPRYLIRLDKDREATLAREGLREFAYAARWTLGERDLNRALPPERIWGGKATICGQMMLLPLALVLKPNEAHYRYAYDLMIFDNGLAKDLHAEILMRLAKARLQFEERGTVPWSVMEEDTGVDPYGYHDVPWVERATTKWSRVAIECAQAAGRKPWRWFQLLEERLESTVHWDAHVPYTVALSAMRFTGNRPRAAMKLVRDFGHDTDSNLQLLGAMIGDRKSVV